MILDGSIMKANCNAVWKFKVLTLAKQTQILSCAWLENRKIFMPFILYSFNTNTNINLHMQYELYDGKF